MHVLSDDELKLGYSTKASGIHSFSESMEGIELTRNLLQWFFFFGGVGGVRGYEVGDKGNVVWLRVPGG